MPQIVAVVPLVLLSIRMLLFGQNSHDFQGKKGDKML
jgi:hypothetical protein